MRFEVTAAMLLLAIFNPGLFSQEAEPSPAETITSAELKDHIYYLASDYLEGRKTGERGFLISARYAASQFVAAGCEPAVVDSQGERSFLQKYELRSWEFGQGNYARVRSGAEESTFALHEDYLLFRFGLEAAGISGDMVFLGYGIAEPEHGWDDYEGVDPAGKLAVIMFGSPQRDGSPVLPPGRELFYQGIGGFVTKYETALRHGAAGVIFIPNKEAAPRWMGLGQFLGHMTLDFPDPEVAGAWLVNSPIPIVFAGPGMTAAMFSGSSYDPIEETGEYGSFQMGSAEIELAIDVEVSPVEACNVVAFLPGSDPALADQVIVVSAHLDHFGFRDGQVMNGADDNASGSAAVLEMAEALALAPTRRTVVFVLYSGEEYGLLGSTYFSANPHGLLGNVIANINIDMIGLYAPQSPGGSDLVAHGSDVTGPDLKQVIDEVALQVFGEPAVHNNTWVGSDHYSFYRFGVPAVTFATGARRTDYHQPGDDAEKLNYEGTQTVSRYLFRLVRELGNRE